MIINATGSKGGGSTPVINPLSVTENGTYTAPSGVDGYSPVVVSVSGGGGGQEDGLVERSISEYTNNTASYVGSYAFYSWSTLNKVSFQNATRLEYGAFQQCGFSFADIPNVTSIGDRAFYVCRKLETVNAPKTKTIGNQAFYSLSQFSAINLPNITSIGSSAFYSCYRLVSFDLRQVSSVPTLVSSGAFSNTPLAGYNIYASQASIYVPASLYEAFKSATNWQYFSNRMVSV